MFTFLFLTTIIYFYSLCGYYDALGFLEFNDADIEYVENSIKTNKKQYIMNTLDPKDFYGYFFYDKPDEFEFTPVEKKRLKAIAAYVNTVFTERGIKDGCNYFQQVSENSNDCADDIRTNDHKVTRTHFFLNKLTEVANQNGNREPGGYRYPDDVKMYATLLRTVAGPLAYDLIQKNLDCALPSLVSTNRYVQKSNCHITEGILRSQELLLYLKERNLPLVVALSEDATRIIGRVQYDSKTNQIVGFALPVSKRNGLPIPFSFSAGSAYEIAKHFAENKESAAYVNAIMAKPISADNIPAFCLLIYSTDNKYDSRSVCQRWTHTVDELKKLDIKVLSFSSDSDPKYNSCMRNLSSLGIKSTYFDNCEWFYCGNKEIDLILPVYIQDTPHLAAKLRNLLLKTIKEMKLLQFGKYYIQQSHVQYLLDNFTKDKHNLTASVVNPIDRQNFEGSVLRLCDEKVINLLRCSVIGSQATIKYLQIIRAIIDSYTDKKLTPIERIEKIWYAVFMLRFWRRDVETSSNRTLKNNFLTTYTYTCVELNAHSLVLLILHLKQQNLPEYFLVHLLNSQPCEALFRQVRSFTSTYSTVANCSVKEILGRMSKIGLQNEISFQLSSDFEVPRLRTPSTTDSTENNLPNPTEIFNQIEKCKEDATRDALEFGLIRKNQIKNFDFACKIPPYSAKQKKSKNLNKHDVVNRDTSYLRLLTNVALKNYAYKFDDEVISQTSPYVELPMIKTGRLIVKKTSLCWLLRKDYARISSDRLERVKSTKKRSKKMRGKYNKQFVQKKY